MKLKIIGFGILLFLPAFSFGQQETKQEAFKPTGKPLLKIFTNFHNRFSDEGSSPAFQVSRAYFGYGYNFNTTFSTKVTLDVGDPGDKLHRTIYLKKVYLQYSKNKLKVNFGLTGAHQFSVQEDFWSRRYMYKSFQDAYGFGPSADLGVTASYSFNEMVEVDGTLVNGEGYKNLQNDSTFKSGVGITVKPFTGLILRNYFDYTPGDAAQASIATFIGYSTEIYSIGMEYNLQNNHNRVNNNDLSGISAYGDVKMGSKTEFFARFDHLTSNKLPGTSSNWHLSQDGQLYIAGIQYEPVQGVKIAPNFQGWDPAANDQSFVPSIFLNLEIKY